MIRRFFYGNFDFEHRLADPTWQAPNALKQLNAELAAAWLAVANDGDFLWTPMPFDDSFFDNAKKGGLPDVVPVTSLSSVPRDVEIVPWGWSKEVYQMAHRFGWVADAPAEPAVRQANSRAISFELESLWNVGLANSHRIESLDDFRRVVRSHAGPESRWVVKAEFGMSARERILGRGNARPEDENWVGRRMELNGAVFFEPWVERISEIGIQFQIPNQGTPQLVGITPMLVNDSGQYAGSWFQFHDSRFCDQKSQWSNCVETAVRAATHVQSLGYFGPLGIDAMIYRGTAGLPVIRPLQDINARWTMGRLSLGWRRFLAAEDEGIWQHCPISQADHPPPLKSARQVRTSPVSVGNASAVHLSRLLISHGETGSSGQQDLATTAQSRHDF